VDYVMRLGLDAIAERVLALNMYLTFRLEKEGFPVLSPAGEHRSGQTLVAVDEPKRARDFLQPRRIVGTEKPEGIRIATHFYNNERDIDGCVEALVAFRASLARS